MSVEATSEALRPRHNNFGLIRLVLAALVVVSHAPELADGSARREPLVRLFHTVSFGMLAVDGFFLLSGFLIVKSWDRDPRLGGFFQKRALRIYPGFLVASLVSVVLVGRTFAVHHASRRLVASGLAWTCLTLAYPSYPAPLTFRNFGIVNGALWTIQWEALCYVAVAVLGIVGLSRRVWPWATMAVVGLSWMAWNDSHGIAGGIEWNQALPRLFGMFAVGALFYVARARVRYDAKASAVAAAALVVCLFVPTLTQTGIALLGGYLLFAFVFASVPHVGHIGIRNDLSYGLYLYAWPVQQVVLVYLPYAALPILVLLTLALSSGLAWLSWRFVERPFLRLKPTARPVSKPVAAP